MNKLIEFCVVLTTCACEVGTHSLGALYDGSGGNRDDRASSGGARIDVSNNGTGARQGTLEPGASGGSVSTGSVSTGAASNSTSTALNEGGRSNAGGGSISTAGREANGSAGGSLGAGGTCGEILPGTFGGTLENTSVLVACGSSSGAGAISTGGHAGAPQCPSLPSCNWCNGVEIFDANGCVTGWRCINGADPCATPPCNGNVPCADGAECGADRLCWPA